MAAAPAANRAAIEAALEQSFRDVLQDVVGLSRAQITLLVDDEGNRFVTELADVSETDLLAAFPTTGRDRLNMHQKSRLRAIRAWALNQTMLVQGDEDQDVDPTDFTDEICRETTMMLTTTGAGDGKTTPSNTSTKSSAVTLATFSGRLEDWNLATRNLMAYLGQQRGCSGLPLTYVIRNDEARPPDILDGTTIAERIWNAPLTGPFFDQDNYQVYQILRQWTAGGTAETHVDTYEHTNDARSAYLEMLANYEGTDAVQAIIQRARHTIHSEKYTGDTDRYKFEDYCKKHQKANNDLIKYNVAYTGSEQVAAFLRGIKYEPYKAERTTILTNPITSSDLNKAVTVFKSNLQTLFNYPYDQRGSSGRSQRSIGGTNTHGNKRKSDNEHYNRRAPGNRGNYNRGQGSGRGQGRGPGRGYMNNNTRSSGNGGPDDGLFLPKHLLDQMSSKQRAAIFKGRELMRNNPNDNGSIPRMVAGSNTAPSNPNDDITEITPNTGASQSFGRRTLSNATHNQGPRGNNGSRNNNDNTNVNRYERQQGGLTTNARTRIVSKTDKVPHETTMNDYSGRFRLEIDSRADTTCCGRGFVPISDTYMECDVHGFHPTMQACTKVPIKTCAMAYDHPDGDTYILEFGQSLYFGDTLENSLLCPNQVRAFHHELCLTPRQFSNGKSLHGIRTTVNHDQIEMLFNMYGCISYLPIRTPTPHELEHCTRITLTSTDHWEPYAQHFNASENVMLPVKFRTANATSSREHRSRVTPDVLARRWGTSIDVAAKTLKVTTQRGIRNLLSPLSRRFRTRQTHMRYPFLKTDVYSDTLFSETKSARGFNVAQVFVTDQDFAEVYPMVSKANAHIKLDAFCKSYGLPQTLITDNAYEETLGNWDVVVKNYLLTQRTVEPYSGWQNRAELEIRELKKHYRRIMHRARCPEAFWCYGLEYTKDIRKFTARASLDWRTPFEVLTGDTPDTTEFIEFDFYGWVKYRDVASGLADPIHLGRWLGVAHNVGQAMCYFILKSNGHVIARTTVRPLLEEELHSQTELEAQTAFMAELKNHVQDFDPNLINTTDSRITEDTTLNDIMVDPTPDVDDNNHTKEQDSGVDARSDNTHGPEPLVGAEVYLAKGDRHEIAKVIGRKRDLDGNYIGRKHNNPILDSRIFTVQFPDGETKDVTYNLIAEHLYSQIDSEGKQYQLFREIINHRKNSRAVDKADCYRIRKDGRKELKKTTAGWDLEVEWKDGTTSWLPLKELKETNTIDVADYAVNNKIEDEPAFIWWVPHVRKKRSRLIAKVKTQKKFIRLGYKFGIRVPCTVEEALEIDAENNNHFWYEAIMKEMSNVKIAFDILDKDAVIPVGYKLIPCRMIFDIKMDFTRKARLVAGGHLTDPPSTVTYSSVVSRDSVRLAFLIAALNDLDVLAADVGNAYLNAPTGEKVFTIAGPEFGPDQGKPAIIVRALYGLKSSGAAWHTFFAQSLTDIGFTSSRADPDVWLRINKRSDGSRYYEYFLVYVDDCLVVSENPREILTRLEHEYKYRLKDVGPPKRFLGARIGEVNLDGQRTWFISAQAYLEKALEGVIQRFGKLETLFSSSKLRTMAKFSVAPREGHLTAVIRCFAYLHKHIQSAIVFDPDVRDWSDKNWISKDWKRFYPDAITEPLPPDMPEPLGNPVQVNLFCDAAHATDLVTRRSTTGFVIFVNGTPIQWYSKRQNTIESSTFGSEFVALKIATEANDAIRYKLRMFGLHIQGPTNVFCDNKSVVTNVSNPESTLSKKHNAIAYHKVRESVAMESLRVSHEPGKCNCSDVFTKFLPEEAHFHCCKSMLYRQ